MAVELQVLIQVVDSEPANPMSSGILFKAQKITSAVAADGTDNQACIAIARAKLDTTVAEASSDIMEQLAEAERGL